VIKVGKMMPFVFLTLVGTRVLLVDDLNLGRSPSGNRSLANLSGSIQNQYGEKVMIVSPQLRSMPGNAASRKVVYRRPIQRSSVMMRPAMQQIGIPIIPVAPVQSSSIQQQQSQSRQPDIPTATASMNSSTPEATTASKPKTKPSSKPDRSSTSQEKPKVTIDDEQTGPDDVDGNLPTPPEDGDLPKLPESSSTTKLPPSRSISKSHPSKSTSKSSPSKSTSKSPPSRSTSKPTADPDSSRSKRSNESNESDADGTDGTEAVAKMVSDVVVPHLKGAKYLKKHNKDIKSAHRNKKAYTNYRIMASKARQSRISRKLKALQEAQKGLENKIERIRNAADEIKNKIEYRQAGIESNRAVAENLRDELNRNNGKLRLEAMEIARLEKALKQEKSKKAILLAQQKIFHDKLDTLTDKDTGDEVRPDENKFNVYSNLLIELEKQLGDLNDKISALIKRKNEELNTRSRLVIRSHRPEETSELPLLAELD